MTRQQAHAGRRLVQARVRYERDPSLPNLRAYERAAARYRAAQSHTRPGYLIGERL